MLRVCILRRAPGRGNVHRNGECVALPLITQRRALSFAQASSAFSGRVVDCGVGTTCVRKAEAHSSTRPVARGATGIASSFLGEQSGLVERAVNGAGFCSGYGTGFGGYNRPLLTMTTPTSITKRTLSTTTALNKSINKSKRGNFIYKWLTQQTKGSGFLFRGQGIKRTWVEDTTDFTEKTGSLKSRNYSYGRDQKLIYETRGQRFIKPLIDRLIKNQEIAEKIPLLRSMPDSLNAVMVLTWLLLAFIFAQWVYRELAIDYDFRREGKADKEWRSYISTVQDETRFSGITQFFYTYLPLRITSRLWGTLNSMSMPGLTKALQHWFIWAYELNMDEAAVQDLSKYPTMQSLFRRRLLPEARPLHPTSTFVAPCDGRVLSYGRLDDTTQLIEQVKGVDYSLKALLGRNKDYTNEEALEMADLTEKQYRESFMKDPQNNDLYYAVIYLAPGDYHRFHSPADWTVTERRHFPGDLYSVNPKIAKWLRNLFVLNERVVLFGEWEHGFMSYTAVGATLVGSIKIYFDEECMTSKPYPLTGCHKHTGHYFDKTYEQKIPLERGEQIGEFNMGSTIITVFEAPKEGFEWTFKEPKEVVRLNTTLNAVFDMKDDELLAVAEKTRKDLAESDK